MKNLKKFEQYIIECDGGGGVAFATPNSNGMGNVVAPTVGTTPGSVWGNGSGTIGSGDIPYYLGKPSTIKSFNDFKIKSRKKRKIKKSKK